MAITTIVLNLTEEQVVTLDDLLTGVRAEQYEALNNVTNSFEEDILYAERVEALDLLLALLKEDDSAR